MSDSQTDDTPADATATTTGSVLSTSGLGPEGIEDALDQARSSTTAGADRAYAADDELPHPDLVDGPVAASATGVGTDDLDAAMGDADG